MHRLYNSDNLPVLKDLAANSVTTVVTDPPAGIAFMGAHWDKDKGGRDEWIAWLQSVMAECYRVTKPGGYLLCWAIPRTSHWTGMAIELAGWEIRDRVTHIFSSGFPHGLDLSKAIDDELGLERKELGRYKGAKQAGVVGQSRGGTDIDADGNTYAHITEPASELAKLFEGYNTTLKPAAEDWWLAMKPLDGTYAQNAMRHGLGGLNIDAARIESGDYNSTMNEKLRELGFEPHGRWPSHVVISHSPRCVEYAEEWACVADCVVRQLDNYETKSGAALPRRFPSGKKKFFGKMESQRGQAYGDDGGASRFFFASKASNRDRDYGLPEEMPRKAVYDGGLGGGSIPLKGSPVPEYRNPHPTVKSLDLMRYLVRLVIPPTGAVVLDPFMGSGTTCMAALYEGADTIGIEQEPEFFKTAELRVNAVADEMARRLF